MKEQVSCLSTDLPSSLSACFRSPSSPFNLDGVHTSSIEILTVAAGEVCIATHRTQEQALWGGEKKKKKRSRQGPICGNHGDRLYCIIPQHRAPGDRVPPSLWACGASPPKHTHLFMTSPTQIIVTKDGSAFFFVAFYFVCMTEFCLRCILFFFLFPE